MYLEKDKAAPRKTTREHLVLNYAALDSGLSSGDERRWAKLLATKRFLPDNFPRYRGEEINLAWARQTGMQEPLVFESPEGLDMVMPDPSITVREIADILGQSFLL